MPDWRSAAASVLVAGALALGGSAAGIPHASAAPPERNAATPAPPREISWTQLGLPRELALTGANHLTEVSVPVPTGVTPAVLTGLIGSVVNTTDARLDVLDSRGVTLASVKVGGNSTTTPLRVDMSRAAVVDGRAPLRFAIRDAGTSADSCTRPPSLVVSELASAYSRATPDPTTVADFLPAFIDGITIHVGPNPTDAQTQAALSLVAALTHLYQPIPVRIDVDVSDDVPVPGPDVRVITLREGKDPSVVLKNPGTPRAVLVITGDGDDLVRQVSLFDDRRFAIAQTDFAKTLSATDRSPTTTTLQTFDQLGIAGDIAVQGKSTLYAGFDAGAFGVGSITNAKVHLKADYTPVVGGTASVVIRSGSTVLATRVLDESGVLDVTGDVPAESITSKVGMALEIQYVPDQDCAPLDNTLRFVIDPSSTVEVTPGSKNRGGFQVLPMAFAPEFDVAIESPQQLRFAADVVNLMAQRSSVILRPHLSTLAESANSQAGLLAVGSGENLTAAGLVGPLMPGAANSVDIDGTSVIDVNGEVGVVQAFTHNDRTVLAVTGSGDWAAVDASLDYIRGLPDRWSSLTGDVVAAGPDNEPVNLTLREGVALVNEYPGDGWKWWAVGSAAAVGAGVLIGAGFLIARRRRPPVIP